jgi:hypothetical protein
MGKAKVFVAMLIIGLRVVVEGSEHWLCAGRHCGLCFAALCLMCRCLAEFLLVRILPRLREEHICW